MRTLFCVDVDHAIHRMLLAVHRRLGTLDIEGRLLLTTVIQTTLLTDVHHAFLSMLLAVRRRLAALGIEARSPLAVVM